MISALTWVLVETTTCSPSLRSLLGKATRRSCHRCRLLGGPDVHDISGRHGERAVVGPDHQRPGRVDVERLAAAYLPCRQVDVDGAAERDADVGVRPRATSRGRRAGPGGRGESRGPGSAGRSARPARRSRARPTWPARSGSSSRVWSTLMPTPTTAIGPLSVSIRSTRMPATLRPAPSAPASTSTSLGHFRAMSGSRSASAAWTAYPVSRGSHDHDVGGTSGRSSTENVSDERAGVSHTRSRRPRPAVWCSVTSDEARFLAVAGARGDRGVGRRGRLLHLDPPANRRDQLGGVDGWARCRRVTHGH